MTSSEQAVLLAAAVVLAIVFWWWAASFARRAWAELRPPWRPLAGYFPGARWHSDVGVVIDQAFLVRALQRAESSLIERTGWDAAALALVGHYVRVHVRNTETWRGLWEKRQSNVYVLTTGPALSTLCHELAHLCELVLEKEVDADHLDWKQRGVDLALEDYEVWLRRQSNEAGGLRSLAACRYKESP